MSVDLLKHEIERFGVVTVMDATLFDIDTNVPVLFLDTLKISNITAEGQEKTITGGKYADLLLTYNFGRSMSLEFQDALISPASMKELWGTTEAEAVMAHNYVQGVASSTSSIVLEPKTLKDGVLAAVELLSATNLTTGVTYTVSGLTPQVVFYDGDITVTATIAVGDIIRVDYKYEVAEGNNVRELILTSSSFPKTVKLVGRTFVLNQNNGNEVQFEIEVPKLKLASNFSMTLDAEGDASVFDFSGMALISGADKELIRFKLLG